MEENRNPEQIDEQQGQSVDEQNDVSVESMMAEIAKLKAENAKNKTALDKALHNNGELTKKLREKMTASEQEEEAKREHDEAIQKHIKDLEDYKRRSEARERYLTMGMSAEHAKLASEAEVAGDMEALAKVQSQHTAALLKEKEAEWLKSRPDVNAGHGEGEGEKDPFLAGFNS